MKIRNIVFPVAFSDRCRGAAPYVREFAKQFGSDLNLLHVVETQYAVIGAPELALLPDDETNAELVQQAQDRLEKFRISEFNAESTRTTVRTGDPAREIVAFAREQAPDLIMMPTHGYGPFRRFILGSVTAKVLHDCDTPVWTDAHTEEPHDASPYIRRVLCAVDTDDRALCVLKWAAALADAWDAKLEVVHAITAPEAQPGKCLDSPFRKYLFDTAGEKIDSLQRNAGTHVTVYIDGGAVARYVSDVAKAKQSDLLVIGRSAHGMLGRLRTHAYALLRESACPVISI